MFKLNKDTDRLIFKLYMYKLSTAYKNHVTVTLTNSLEETIVILFGIVIFINI